MELTKISLHVGSFKNDFAIDLKVEASLDKKNWERINYDFSQGEFTKSLVQSPKSPVENIYLRKQKAKYLKIIQIGNDSTKNCYPPRIVKD